MPTRCLPFTLSLVFFALCGAASAHAEGPEDKPVQKTLKTLVNAIRYKKDDLAAKQLAYPEMAKLLLADQWGSLSAPDQKEFVTDLEVLLRKISFAKGREIFQYLDAVLYSPVTLEGDKAHCKSTVVIHRDLKKTEIPLEWVLVKSDGAWKVLDTIATGESTAAAIRQDQVQPLIKEGGTNALMDAVRKKAAELSKT